MIEAKSAGCSTGERHSFKPAAAMVEFLCLGMILYNSTWHEQSRKDIYVLRLYIYKYMIYVCVSPQKLGTLTNRNCSTATFLCPHFWKEVLFVFQLTNRPENRRPFMQASIHPSITARPTFRRTSELLLFTVELPNCHLSSSTILEHANEFV